MDMRQIQSDDGILFRVTGRFEIAVSARFFDTALAAANASPGSNMTIDVGGLQYIDSSGLGKLVQLSRHLADSGRTFSVVNAQGDVLKAFQLFQLSKLMVVG